MTVGLCKLLSVAFCVCSIRRRSVTSRKGRALTRRDRRGSAMALWKDRGSPMALRKDRGSPMAERSAAKGKR